MHLLYLAWQGIRFIWSWNKMWKKIRNVIRSRMLILSQSICLIYYEWSFGGMWTKIRNVKRRKRIRKNYKRIIKNYQKPSYKLI